MSYRPKEYITISKEFENFLQNMEKKQNIKMPISSDNRIELSLFITYLNDLGIIDFPLHNFVYCSSSK